MATASHLATCGGCFKVFSGIKEMENALKSVIKATGASKNCPEDWEIAVFIKNEPAGNENIRKHMNDCDFCLDRASAYYKAEGAQISLKTPDEWKDKALNAMLGTEVEKTMPENHKALNFFKKISKPKAVFSGFALAAAAMAAFFIWAAMPEGTKVITIRSSEKLAFREVGAPSSFGFMGRERVEKFGGMEISKKGDNLFLDWKNIPGAKGYSLSVINLSTGTAIMSGRNTEGPKAAIPSNLMKKDELYRWVVKGTNQDGEDFEYTGEFLLTN